MLPVAPGVYVSPRMSKGVRERIWQVMLDWAGLIPEDGGLLLLWRDAEAPAGLSLRALGWPKKEILDHEGLWLTVDRRHDVAELESLAQIGCPPAEGEQ
jgi:CRISPR-associated protein Cas2